MVKFGPILVGALLLVSLLSVADARRHSKRATRRDPSYLRTGLNWVPAIRLGKLTDSACGKPSANDNGMHVAIPHRLFKNGEVCGKNLLVSCAEPYRDLGGPWKVCQRKRINVTIIDQVFDDPMDDDLFRLSDKAFNRLARPETASIRLILH